MQTWLTKTTGMLAGAMLFALPHAAMANAPQPTAGFEDMIQDLAALVSEDNSDALTRLRLAAMLDSVGMHDEARNYLREAMAIDPNINNFFNAGGDNCADCPRGAIGPDVITGDLNGMGNYGFTGTLAAGTSAFSVGTTSCNLGDQNLTWSSGTNVHPVMPQNMYRLKDGRFQQIGMSWLKHGFCALQQNLCGGCATQTGCLSFLKPNCSDPYSASLNGDQSILGPRWQVNATTGVFPYPYANPPGNFTTTARRLQVLNADLDAAQNPGAVYWVEGVYVHPQDAAFGNAMNNASYRRINMTYSMAQSRYNASFAAATVRMKPAIVGWQDFDPTVSVANVDNLDEGGAGVHGRFIAAWKVTDNGDGTWRYEYSVYNHNCDQSGGSFSIPVGNGVNISNAGFYSPFYHSNDGIGSVTQPNTPWDIDISNGAITWSTQSHGTNPNANALRWATMYNFWFTADTAPEDAEVTIGLFKPGVRSALTFTGSAPAGCELDGDFTGDGVVDFDDFSEVLNGYGTTYDFDDFSAVLANYGQKC